MNKKRNRDLPENYRPIYFLPSFLKAAYQQIKNFFENNQIFIYEQFGFRRGRSTISAVASFIHHIYIYIYD